MQGGHQDMKRKEIKQYYPLLMELLKRDIKVKYRKSVFGSVMEYIKSIIYDDDIIRCVFNIV